MGVHLGVRIAKTIDVRQNNEKIRPDQVGDQSRKVVIIGQI